MSPVRVTRRYAEYIQWLRAAAFVAVTAVPLLAMRAFPIPVSGAIAVAAGAISVFSPPAAVIAAVIAVSVPVLTANFVVGLVLLLAGLSATVWLGSRGALRFLLIAGAVALLPIHAEWSMAIVAGYLLGAVDGALTAAIACVLIELIGLVAGFPSLGAQATGGVASIVRSLTAAAPVAFSVARLSAAARGFDLGSLPAAVLRAQSTILLIAQPAAWALAGVIAGLVGDRFSKMNERVIGALVAAAGGAVALTVFIAVAGGLLQSPAGLAMIVMTGGASVVVALAWLLIWELVFKMQIVVLPDAPSPAIPVVAPLLPADTLVRALRQPRSLLTEAPEGTTVLIAEAVPAPGQGEPDPMAAVISALAPYSARGTSGRGAVAAAFDDPLTALAAGIDALRAAAIMSRTESPPSAPVRVGVAGAGCWWIASAGPPTAPL